MIEFFMNKIFIAENFIVKDFDTHNNQNMPEQFEMRAVLIVMCVLLQDRN